MMKEDVDKDEGREGRFRNKMEMQQKRGERGGIIIINALLVFKGYQELP